MPRKVHNALTPLTVKSSKPGRHADGNGLYLLVKETGARSWVFRFMLKGEAGDMGLGPAAGANALSLAKARDDASALRVKVKAGINPLRERERSAAEARAAAQAAMVAGTTFKSVAEAYIAANEGTWRNDKHRQQWGSTLRSYVYPVIGEVAAADVSTSHVMAILEPIWAAKPETASRVRGRMEAVLDAAKARGYRSGENPARWRGHIAQLLPARKHLSRGHHKAMPYDDLPAFFTALSSREAVAALALEFTILTAARTSEVLGACRSEVDLAKAVWTIPADRMKAGREHRVPLSPRAIAILRKVEALDGEWLFPGTGKGRLSTMAMTMLLRRMGVDVTVHGFRSSFRDWSAERTSFTHEVCEMALAHTISNKSEASYRRGDVLEKRRKLMEAWASYCGAGSAAGAKVMAIGSARAA